LYKDTEFTSLTLIGKTSFTKKSKSSNVYDLLYKLDYMSDTVGNSLLTTYYDIIIFIINNIDYTYYLFIICLYCNMLEQQPLDTIWYT